MQYTTGQWTVSSLYKDTIQTSKNLSVPDLSYTTDYRKSSDEPNEATLTNMTSSEISSPESIRYGASVVNNVYQGTNIDITSMAPSKKGVQTLVELTEVYRASNTAGMEFELPCKGRIVLRFPTHACVTSAMVTDLLIRTVAAALNTGVADAARQVELARGSLLPEGV